MNSHHCYLIDNFEDWNQIEATYSKSSHHYLIGWCLDELTYPLPDKQGYSIKSKLKLNELEELSQRMIPSSGVPNASHWIFWEKLYRERDRTQLISIIQLLKNYGFHHHILSDLSILLLLQEKQAVESCILNTPASSYHLNGIQAFYDLLPISGHIVNPYLEIDVQFLENKINSKVKAFFPVYYSALLAYNPISASSGEECLWLYEKHHRDHPIWNYSNCDGSIIRAAHTLFHYPFQQATGQKNILCDFRNLSEEIKEELIEIVQESFSNKKEQRLQRLSQKRNIPFLIKIFSGCNQMEKTNTLTLREEQKIAIVLNVDKTYGITLESLSYAALRDNLLFHTTDNKKIPLPEAQFTDLEGKSVTNIQPTQLFQTRWEKGVIPGTFLVKRRKQ